MYRERCLVLENKKVAPGHFVLRMRSPRISKAAEPGQFVQVLCEDTTEPLLPRPFSFLTATKKDFSFLYHVVGKGTAALAQKKKGDSLWVLGPLGHGFTLSDHRPQTTDRRQKGRSTVCSLQSAVLVGGGVGIPPLYHLAQAISRQPSAEIHVFLGARDKSLLLCEKDFKALGVSLKVATDDGSKGKKGFVTELLQGYLSSVFPARPAGGRSLSSVVYACGPTPMLKAVSAISEKYGTACEGSVEGPVARRFWAFIVFPP